MNLKLYKFIMLVSLLMLSNIAAAWPVSLNQTIGTGDISLGIKDSSDTAFPLEISYSYAINIGSFTETNTGSSSGLICAAGDTEDMADGETREGFSFELNCLPSKFI